MLPNLNANIQEVARKVNPVDRINFQDRFESRKINSVNHRIESISNKMVDSLKDPDGKAFYCKIAKDFTEFEIDKAIELALKYGRNPAAYFNRIMTNKRKA